MKAALIYFSKGGKTKRYAERIAKDLGLTPYRLYPKIPYSTYGRSILREANDRIHHHHPEYIGQLPDLKDTEYLFIGFPIWFGDAPEIVQHYLSHNDLHGKKIIPFATSSSTNISSTLKSLKRVCRGASIWLPLQCKEAQSDYYHLWIHEMEKIISK